VTGVKTAISAVVAVALGFFAVSAEATWPVGFYVDSEPVAVLQASSPFIGPVKLEGRSGAQGDDERSGLYDNVRVCLWWDAHGLCWPYDEFETLDLFVWGLYGGPSPHLLVDFGNPAPCVMTSGDSLYASGLYSLGRVPLGSPVLDAWYFDVDVYVGGSSAFHAFEFGIADADAPSGPPGQQTLGLLAGVRWSQGADGVNVLQCITDVDYVEIPAVVLPEGWHAMGFSGRGFTPVSRSTWGQLKAIFKE
jgi:hypothetical protein